MIVGRIGPQRAFFDLWARIYDFPPVQLATYRPVHNAVLRALREHSPRRILDVGCGTGQLAARLLVEFPAVRWVGCDLSTGMLAQAALRLGIDAPAAPRTRRRGTDRQSARVVRGDALHLPFRAGSVDAVVCTEAFHWFPDHDRALGEMFRVLAPGGTLLLALVNPPLAIVSSLVHLGSRVAGQPLYWPTPTRLRAQLEAAGFRVDRQRRLVRFPGFLLPPMLTEARRLE